MMPSFSFTTFVARALSAVLVIASFTLFQSVSLAQEPNEGEELLIMNMPDLDIRSLIQWAVDSLDKNIVVHRSVQGNVTILAENPLTKEEAWEVFLSALQVSGFTAVETGAVIRIIPAAEAIQTNIPIVEFESDANSTEMILKLIRVENIPVSQLVTLLRPLIPQVGYLSAFDESNTLIIADYANNLNRIENIITSIDQASSIDVELVHLENANANTVITILNTLISTDTTSQVSLAVDERTNSLLMTGDVTKRQQMRVIIANLDQPLIGIGNTHVIYIHYMDAEDLIPIIRSVVESVQNEQRNEALNQVNVNIESSETANAIIITAPPSVMTVVRSVIERLDIRRAQVLVEAIIVEVNQDNINELGVLWSTGGENLGGDGIVASAATLTGTLTDALNTDGGIPNISLLGTGFTLGYYRGGSLRAMLRALETDTAVNVLSTPSIITLDNEEAEIIVGSNVPFLTGSRETTGSASLFNTIERRDIGISLRISPQINDGDSITLEINQTVESVIDRDEAADIQTDKREINTKVIIYDGDILVLGGLIKNSTTDSEIKVPLLGDIPLVGRLFRSRKATTERKNLMVFIHATILKDQITENRISMERYNGIREQQMLYGESLNSFRQINSETTPLLPEFEEFNKSSLE